MKPVEMLRWCLTRMHLLNNGRWTDENTCAHIDCQQMREWIEELEKREGS